MSEEKVRKRGRDYGLSSGGSCIDCLCNQRIVRADYYSIFEKVKSGADREGRIKISFEKNGNTDYGGIDYIGRRVGSESVLYTGLPQDHSDFIFDSGIWGNWIFGRLFESSAPPL